jgi:hypothetical protein
VTVAIPVIPDVTVDFDCRLRATSRGADLSGQLHGHALFSRAAVALYDWFSPGHVRGCQVLPP